MGSALHESIGLQAHIPVRRTTANQLTVVCKSIMLDPIIGGLFAVAIAVGGGAYTFMHRMDERLDALEVKIAEHYLTKDDLDRFILLTKKDK